MIPPQRVVLGFSFGRSVEPRLCPLRAAGVGSSDSIAVARLPVGALRALEIHCGTTKVGFFIKIGTRRPTPGNDTYPAFCFCPNNFRYLNHFAR